LVIRLLQVEEWTEKLIIAFYYDPRRAGLVIRTPQKQCDV
jgi:hypothetical protein